MDEEIKVNSEQKENKPKEKINIIEKIKEKKRVIFVLLVTLITAIVAYVIFRGNYLETLEIGENYINVFWQNVRYTTITLVVNFLIVFLLFYFTNHRIKKGLKEFFEQENKKMPKLINKSISFIIAIIVSALTSGVILEKLMLFVNSRQFGRVDSIFGMDIGYFIFQKPFIELVLWYILIALAASTIYMVVYYIICFNRFFDGVDRKTLKNSKLIKQLTTTVMVFAIFLAALVFVTTQDIATDKFLTLEDNSSTYSLYGAGYSDVTIKLWGYRILCLVIIISVRAGIKAFKQGNRKKILISILTVPTYLLGLIVVLIGFQVIFVSPNEIDKEKEYIQANIDNTKDAYGINIEEVILKTPETIETADIVNNKEIINNIPVVSKDLTLKDLNSTQTAKGYYTYTNTKIGKYYIDGEETLIYVTPREIVSSGETYNNKTYEYTHGYSTILTLTNTTKEDGTISHVQKSFEETNEKVTITEPRIYFGMQTNDTIVTNIKGRTEFDYPTLDANTIENAENTYDGKAGLTLNLIDRIILGINQGDLKLAFSSNVTSQSKILTNRNIIERAKTVMPYLKYDENPYLVINDEGKLIWVLDAYTTSNAYPYSQKTVLKENSTNREELNYIRNSVKVLIDAYDGTMKFYITDKNDQIAMVYYDIFPDLFVDKDEQIPADIAEHLVYPEFLYNIQADIVTRYHNVEPNVLYRSDDIWEIATHNTGKVITKTGTDIEPYYTMVKTPNSEKAELTLLLPYTPYGKQNLISYLAGTYDNSGNAKLTIYKYSTDSNVMGPMQLDTQIEQDATIAEELENLKKLDGTKIIKNMIIVPIDNTILYVEPIYQQYLNEKDVNSTTPTLKKVIVASGNKVAIGNNLKQALNNLVSKYATNIEVENTDSIEDLINAIIKANNNLTNSNARDDWEMIGQDVKKLQELINKLQVVVEEEKKEENIEEENIINEDITNTINSNIASN